MAGKRRTCSQCRKCHLKGWMKKIQIKLQRDLNFVSVWKYLHFRWHLLPIVSSVSSRWRRSVWDSCPFPGPSFQQKLQKLLEELFATTSWTFHYNVGIMEFSNMWQSKEQFVLYSVYNFCLWSCLVGLHRPFDALLRNENHAVISKSLCCVCQPHAFPSWLAPPCWHSQGSEPDPDFILYPSMSLAKTLVSYSDHQWK